LGISASLLAFLLYNIPPAHIFRGDFGSLFIGMLLATFTFVFIENKTGVENI
jgi:UDP-GlcNAc:undecaprenyl-phosphate GlcNAc-1-phosphate transferase